MDFVWNLFFMFGGVAVMMFGMKIMGEALEKFAGPKMKNLLGKATTNRFAGVGVGTAVTAVIQSSTATTVMLVGFVNVGLMTLTQAANVIMGANIGTTVTAHLTSLQGIGEIDIGAIFAIIGMIGVFMAMLIKNDKVKNIGNLLGALGLIFIGLEVISIFAKKVMIDETTKMPFPFVQTIFQGDIFPLLLVLIGIVLTALVHSSSTVTSLMVVLCGITTANGPLLTFDNALFLTLGSNIGTCVTSILAGAGTNVNARRTGVVHLLFNCIGCFVFLAPLWIWRNEVVWLFNQISPYTGRQLAIFHTVFNVVTTALLIGFIKWVVKLACLIVPDKKKKDGEEQEKKSLHFIDKRLLETPRIAFANTKKELIRMSEFAKENVNLSVEMLTDGNIDNETVIRENEEALNFINHGVVNFLTQLMGKDLPEADDRVLGTYYHVVNDIERVGDYAENILEYSLRLRKNGDSFSEHAREELGDVVAKLNELFDLCVDAFDRVSFENYDKINQIEDYIDSASERLEEKHIDRVKRNACTAELGSVYLQTVSNLERIGDHITNIAKSMEHYKTK